MVQSRLKKHILYQKKQSIKKANARSMLIKKHCYQHQFFWLWHKSYNRMASYFLLQFFHQGGERSGRYKIASELEVAPFGRKKILKTFLTEQKIKIKLVQNKTTLLCLVQFFCAFVFGSC